MHRKVGQRYPSYWPSNTIQALILAEGGPSSEFDFSLTGLDQQSRNQLLAGRPVQTASAKQVNVEMKNRLSRPRAHVEHRPVTAFDSAF